MPDFNAATYVPAGGSPIRSPLLLLNAVVAAGAGNAVAVAASKITVYIEATNVTSGGTMKIQSLTPTGNWVDLDSRSITANGTTVVTVDGAFNQIRANLSARTDGTYSVSMDTR